jgi:hypothetical protein
MAYTNPIKIPESCQEFTVWSYFSTRPVDFILEYVFVVQISNSVNREIMETHPPEFLLRQSSHSTAEH